MEVDVIVVVVAVLVICSRQRHDDQQWGFKRACASASPNQESQLNDRTMTCTFSYEPWSILLMSRLVGL